MRDANQDGRPRQPDPETDCPSAPNSARAKDLFRTPMVRWFSPALLFQAAMRDVVSRMFALYADKRAILAALEPGRAFLDEWYDRDRIWIDFVADLGDGWNSTYAIAHGLSQAELVVQSSEGEELLSRGSILVMGGDEVYPYATAGDYKRKMEGPYQAALPCSADPKPPHLFAIPGNHDWTDGLTAFTHFFCQDRWIGGRKTAQSQSYFAVRLPHGWWLWGIDIQLQSYIDRPQLEYFRSVAGKHMQPGDQVILCLAEPSWVYAATTDGKLHRNIAYLERDIIAPCGGELRVCVTGDLHHYAVYREVDANGEAVESGRVKLTCGGGGAFVHGTHHLPDSLQLDEAEGKRNYRLDSATHPSADTSRRLLKRNLLFPMWNPSFAVGVGFVYLLFAALLQRAGNGGGGGLLERLRQIPVDVSGLGPVVHLFGAQLLYSPMGIISSLALIAVLTVFARPDWRKYTGARIPERTVAGFVHASMHTGAFVLCTWAVSHWSTIDLPLRLPDWDSIFRFGVAEFVLGGIAGAFVFGLYLYVSNRWLAYHRTEAFSSLRIPDYKSFLRFHLDERGLTVYPIGIGSVPRRWRRRSGNPAPEESWFDPEDGGAFHLIHDPIHVPGPVAAGMERGRNRGAR